VQRRRRKLEGLTAEYAEYAERRLLLGSTSVCSAYSAVPYSSRCWSAFRVLGAFCFAVGLAAASPAVSVTPKEYFVSPSGCATNAGTELSPWPSIETALSKISGGDIVTLMPGTYAEAVVIEVSGTLDFPTVLRSQRKWEAIIKGPPSHGIYTADGVTNVLIDGLQVAEAQIDGIKVGSFATVRNCWIHHSTRQGISAHRTRRTTLEYNLIEHNGTDPAFDHGIYLSGTNDVVRGNVIRWNKTYGCQIYYDPPASSSGCQFYNNLVYGNRNALTVWSPGGQTNYVFNNTLISGRYVLIANGGTLCVTNNILIGVKRRQVLCAEDGAIIRGDYNLTPVPGKQRGPHDVVAAKPGFVKPGAGLYWLRSDSPAWGSAAEHMGPPVDFFGRKQSRVLSVGAFPFRGRLASDTRVLDPSPARPDYWATNLTARP